MTLSRTTYKLLIYVLPVVLVALGFILLYEILPALAQQTPTQADVDAARRLAAEAARATETQNTFIARVLWWVVATVFGGLTWVAGGLLDWSITTLVLNFGTIFQNSGLGVAVNQLWAVVRDIFNLTFIFGLVYIGFRLVVNAESSTARKAIVSLIIAALLVNFSLFITKTVIDFSNIAAVQISQLIYSGNLPTSNSTSSISLAFGNQMGLASLWGQSEAEVQRNTIANNRNTAPSGGLLYIFGAMILFLIAAFAFIVGAVLLISRFIALNFMMILSPVMFLGFVFAPLQSLSSQYWSKFLNQCFFAPAFLLMIYFSLYILGTFTSIVRQQGSTIANTLENGTNISSIAGFLLGGGFLLASVMIAQKMGAHGASTAMKIGGSFANSARAQGQRLAGRMTLGTGAAIGQRTLGYTASRFAGSKILKDFAARNPTVGRAAYMATKKVADSSFDVRQTAAGKALGVGEGSKGGYDTRVKDKTKQYETFLDALDTNKDLSRDETNRLADTELRSTNEGNRLIQTQQDATTLLAERRIALQNEISDSNRQSQALTTEVNNPATTEARKQELAVLITALNGSIQRVRDNYTAELTRLQQEATVATQALNTAQTNARSEVTSNNKYGLQLQFINNLEKSNERWGSIQRVLGGAVGYGVSAATLGVVPSWITAAPIAALTGAGSSAGIITTDATRALRESYGANGSKKAKKKQQQDQLSLVADSLRDNNTIPAAPAPATP